MQLVYWGVFITAKVEEGQGSIVQILFVQFTEEEKKQYERILLRLANPLNDWLFDEEVINRGYLEPHDFPTWLSSEQRDIIESRFKMWSAFYTRALHVKAFMPVGQLKLSINYEYNKQKWGLDMCTENYVKISYGSVSLLFETKYILRMLDGIVANGWKVEQGHTLIKPFIEKYIEDHDGERPTNAQIRSEAKKLTLEDYTYDLSVEWLKALERERIALILQEERESLARLNTQSNTRNVMNTRDAEMLAVIERYQQQDDWPMKTKKLKRFSKDDGLNKLRKYKSNLITHPCESHVTTDKCKSGKKTCSMCSSGIKSGRTVRTFCSRCGVTLCTKVQDGFETSCFDAWHTVDDLVQESKRRAEAVIQSRASNGRSVGVSSSQQGQGAEEVAAAVDDSSSQQGQGAEQIEASADSDMPGLPALPATETTEDVQMNWGLFVRHCKE